MKFFILLSIVSLAFSSPISQDDSVFRLVVSNFVSCMNSDLSLCLKEHALRATERIGTLRQLKITDGITIINNGPKESRSLDLSPEPEERRKQITQRLWESTSNLLQTSELELSYAPAVSETEEESRAIVEGRGKDKKEKKKKLKILIPLLILAKIKAVALVVISIVVIAASIFKLAVLAKIAFLAKLFAIIKALIAKKHQEDHGWAPVHDEHESHGWDQGWSRSSEANKLAYSAYHGN